MWPIEISIIIILAIVVITLATAYSNLKSIYENYQEEVSAKNTVTQHMLINNENVIESLWVVIDKQEKDLKKIRIKNTNNATLKNYYKKECKKLKLLLKNS